ncbi:agmatine deiminase family protein [Glaciecola sp. XM2]|jgi:agmatine/peptidylarginine deiminase|uniref:agmatine deiminase family protein n=1 Tax=Glaciecola sp. XM2 TaxID=1914931 RepID=UPI001BDDE568|nr:agmatine deiminase family protein [Glaciecola sp. XM2]MBT1451195.1 agmatine deiminase family protein [Glaciecola sp. XM2]
MPNSHTLPSLTLLPEWARQEAVVLAWPHGQSDWLPWLDQARATYVELITAINAAGAAVILLCDDSEYGIAKSMISMHARVLIVKASYNDTWTRDYVFVTCESEAGNTPVEFTFNGWGQKFNAQKDNEINKTLAPFCQQALITCATVLEGGAIEIDQNQILMTTASCLYNPKRNGDMDDASYTSMFSDYLGAQQTFIFKHGHLEGDDTDGHIDTLARFTPLRGIVMQSAFNRPQDPHFSELNALRNEIQSTFADYSLFELPLPHMTNAEGDRLPASYANFLICNQTILAPIYNQPEDAVAIEVLQKAFANYKIVPIDCSVIVHQFGSLHCITMQIPHNTLKPDILERVNNGVASL